jgi:hypothetical protein
MHFDTAAGTRKCRAGLALKSGRQQNFWQTWAKTSYSQKLWKLWVNMKLFTQEGSGSFLSDF